MACSLAPTRAATGTPCVLPSAIIAGGGTPRALAIRRMGNSNAASSTSIARPGSNGCGWSSRTVCSARVTPTPPIRSRAESGVRRRHARLEAVVGNPRLPGGGHVLGDQHVDAERLAAGVILDPAHLLAHRFRRVGGGPEHAEPARPAHRRHHVAAVAEGQKRELDAEHCRRSETSWFGPQAADDRSSALVDLHLDDRADSGIAFDHGLGDRGIVRVGRGDEARAALFKGRR